jgi:hypothetical protein
MAAMQSFGPTIDRLGAALRAVRQTYRHEPGESQTALGVKCLQVVIAELAAEGLAQEDLQPLADLEAHLGRLQAQGKDERTAERRKGRPPSDVLLARLAAVIDLLIKAGYDEEDAAQIVMRRLMAAGVPPPQQGGDARGWKRLLSWRADLGHGVASEAAKQEHRDFTQELESIPAGERVKRVLDEKLWDRRRKAP